MTTVTVPALRRVVLVVWRLVLAAGALTNTVIGYEPSGKQYGDVLFRLAYRAFDFLSTSEKWARSCCHRAQRGADLQEAD
jgi:hypothetical protein